MTTINIKGKEYKIKFGYNSFCDTDLMDRVEELLMIFYGTGVKSDKDVNGMGEIKTLFTCTRDLLFVGFKKHNPVESVQEVGDLLDDYHDEATEEDERNILDLFMKLTEELMNEGFFGQILKKLGQEEPEETEKVTKMPQDHKKKQK